MIDFSGNDFEIDEVELEEYQGEALSSIYDFRENSIEGPQYITREKYRLTINGLVNNSYSLSYDEILNSFM